MTLRDLAVIVKGIAPVLREALQPVADRVRELETLAKGEIGATGKDGAQGPPGIPGRDGMSVQGGQGEKGRDGTDGRDGQDGLGFDDLSVLHDGERGVTFRFLKGDHVKEFTVTVPALIYRGVYTEGKTYTKGDVGTWAGATWHCNEPTTLKPGEGTKAWTLMVKKGRDGKDGRDVDPGLPVVKLR